MSEEFLGATIDRETDEAILAIIDGESYWIPKSVIHETSGAWHEGDEGTLTLKTWWVSKGRMTAVSGDECRMKGDSQPGPASITVTHEQRRIIAPAVDAVRQQHGDRGLNRAVPEGRCIELICADYLAGSEADWVTEATKLRANLVELTAAVDSALGSGTVEEVLRLWRGK